MSSRPLRILPASSIPVSFPRGQIPVFPTGIALRSSSQPSLAFLVAAGGRADAELVRDHLTEDPRPEPKNDLKVPPFPRAETTPRR